jgi:hypothetical protein
MSGEASSVAASTAAAARLSARPEIRAYRACSPVLVSSSKRKASQAPEDSALLSPQATNPAAKPRKVWATVQSRKQPTKQSEAAASANRRDRRSATTPAGTSATKLVADQMAKSSEMPAGETPRSANSSG